MVNMELDIVVSRNGQLQWSIIGSDMPSALGLVENETRTPTAPFIAI